MKSVPVVGRGGQWVNAKLRAGEPNPEGLAWACTACGRVYRSRLDAQHCYNAQTFPDMPSVKNRRKPLFPVGDVAISSLDQKLVDRWT